MDCDEARARIEEIQRIVERTTLWPLLPGAAAVLGGMLVLAGCGVSYGMLRSFDFAALLTMSPNAQMAFCCMWFGIGAIGVIVQVAFTAHAAKKQGLSPTTRSARVATFSMTPSLLVAMVLTIRFLIPVAPRTEEVQYIVPVWMMLYGTGVYSAGLFSVRPPRILGLTFLGTGVIALLFFPGYGVVSAAASFGLLHIVFGIYILRKRRRGQSR